MTIGGEAAQGADFLDAVYGNFPLMLALISILTFILLARAFRSLILPLKAVLLNLLSVAAAWGLIVLVFQKGFGSDEILGIEATQAINVEMPIVIFAFLFGISMDYQVFIISRMREAYDRTGSTETAVVEGIGRTGRLVTSAALILGLAFVAFGAQPGTEAKIFALALGGGILIDATIIRGVLTPAAVAILGRWNWWLPDWAARILRVEPSPARAGGNSRSRPSAGVGRSTRKAPETGSLSFRAYLRTHRTSLFSHSRGGISRSRWRTDADISATTRSRRPETTKTSARLNTIPFDPPRCNGFGTAPSRPTEIEVAERPAGGQGRHHRDLARGQARDRETAQEERRRQRDPAGRPLVQQPFVGRQALLHRKVHECERKHRHDEVSEPSQHPLLIGTDAPERYGRHRRGSLLSGCSLSRCRCEWQSKSSAGTTTSALSTHASTAAEDSARSRWRARPGSASRRSCARLPTPRVGGGCASSPRGRPSRSRHSRTPAWATCSKALSTTSCPP